MKTRVLFSFLFVCMSVTAFFSCTEEDLAQERSEKVEIQDPAVTMEVPNLLKFESREHLQGTLDLLKEEKISDLKSEVLLKRLIREEDILCPASLRSDPNAPRFISLYDEGYERELGSLTPSEWEVINSDPDDLVYEPVDSIIPDVYLTSLMNTNREIQVDKTIYKYTEDGIYMVAVENYDQLASPATSSGVTLVASQAANVPTSTNHVTATGSLTLGDGTVIPRSNIRDKNFKDKTDANWLTRFWTGIFGDHIVAIKEITNKRQMTLNFYDQDYLIYHNIGTEVKMQKKLFGIWWKCKADDMRIGWEGIELEESFNLMPFGNVPKPNFSSDLYPSASLKDYEKTIPNWMKKNFPFEDTDQILFNIPVIHYNFTTKDINQIWKSGVATADKSIKAYMKAFGQSNRPKGTGFYTMPAAKTIRFFIGPKENQGKKKRSMEKKFLSEWFAGTYVIGFSTDPNKPSFKCSNFSFKIKGDKSKLARGSVYGAVKYDNKWYAARILKSE